MFQEFNNTALESGEIDEEFMNDWYIELEDDELDTWNQAFDSDDEAFLDMMKDEFDASLVDKFFEICYEKDVFPAENSHDDEGNITEEYKTLLIDFYDNYFKS